jgi:hypothetical protein
MLKILPTLHAYSGLEATADFFIYVYIVTPLSEFSAASYFKLRHLADTRRKILGVAPRHVASVEVSN